MSQEYADIPDRAKGAWVRRAVDGVFHQQVEHAASTSLYRDVPRGGKAFCAFCLAELIQRAVAGADRFGGHLDAAAARQIVDEDTLFGRRDAVPALCLARDGGEGQVFGEVWFGESWKAGFGGGHEEQSCGLQRVEYGNLYGYL